MGHEDDTDQNTDDAQAPAGTAGNYGVEDVVVHECSLRGVMCGVGRHINRINQ
ncbi:hypothetical protein D9M73_243920 [compost metagenome]